MAKPTILLIESNKILAQTYQTALESAGYKVDLAANAQAAIAGADEGRPDLVILELELARHNGIEFLYEFRSYTDWQSVPVIINSSIKPEKFLSSQKQLELLGVSRYLYKLNASLDTLVAAVASELEYAAISH